MRRPKDYSFTIASWSKEQLDYFDALTELFSDFINPAALGKTELKLSMMVCCSIIKISPSFLELQINMFLIMRRNIETHEQNYD